MTAWLLKGRSLKTPDEHSVQGFFSHAERVAARNQFKAVPGASEILANEEPANGEEEPW